MRGIVRQADSTPFWGCRVFDRLNPVIGSALTDKNGRFELVVDGGFLVQLEFIRHPTTRFTAHLDIYVPVNQIVNIGDFYLTDRSLVKEGVLTMNSPLNEGAVVGVGGILPASPIFGDLWAAGLMPSKNAAVSSCPPGIHDISALGGPTIEPNDQIDIGDDSVTCLDNEESVCVSQGVLSHRVAIKVRPRKKNDFYEFPRKVSLIFVFPQPSNVHLIHKSDKTEKSTSSLVINMLGRDRAPPEQLSEVHLSIDVAGQRQSWRFEPTQGLEFTFVWNRTDGYNRSVYGSVPTRGKGAGQVTPCTLTVNNFAVTAVTVWQVRRSALIRR